MTCSHLRHGHVRVVVVVVKLALSQWIILLRYGVFDSTWPDLTWPDISSFSVRLSPPLDSGPVTICNCSICSINGYMMVYPLESQITWNSGLDDLSGYTFGPARITHTFCSICGTSIGGKSNEQAFSRYRALNVSSPHLRLWESRVSAVERARNLTSLFGRQCWGQWKSSPLYIADNSYQIRTLRGVDMDNLTIRNVDTRGTKVTDELS